MGVFRRLHGRIQCRHRDLALHYKTVTGEGQHIDISMQDGIWAMVFPDRADYSKPLFPKRIGNRLSSPRLLQGQGRPRGHLHDYR